jgi:hypothetical protein
MGSGGVDGVVAAVELLVAADLDSCAQSDLDVLAGVSQRVRGFVAAFDARVARRRAVLWSETAASGSSGPSTVGGESLDLGGMPERDRRSGREVEQDRVRAAVGSVLPMFEAAVGRGEIDAAHVDAVGRAWRDLDEVERAEFVGHAEVLLGWARVESPERFGRRCRDLARQVLRDHGLRVAERQRRAANVRRWVDARTGMGHVHAELDPEATARIWAAIDAHLAVVTGRDETAGIAWSRVEVDALVELVCASGVVDPRVASLSVIVDYSTLQTATFAAGAVCETTDGHPLSPAAVRRLACDAGIVPVVLGADGIPLDVGRARRLATPAQRRALAVMYATCAFAGCTVRFERCRIHHCDPWLPIGPTDLANLVPVCDRHHHQIHDGGWTLTMTADRTITLRAPDGTVTYHGDTRDRHPAPDNHDREVLEPPDLDPAVAVETARTRARALARCRNHDTRLNDPTDQLGDTQPHNGP